ncbi:MAG: PDZ domain-containing protein, partial [Patescibacteria group bacterium]
MNFRSFFKTNAFLILAFVLVFLAGWQVGYAGLQFSFKLSPPGITVENKAPKNQTIDFSLMWDVIERINADYLFRPVDGSKLLYGAVSGLIEALGDPYTSFLDPTQNQQFTDGLSGVYEGIGAEIGMRADQLIIVAPLDGSPAKTAGLRAGDKILEIDGESSAGVTVTGAVTKIRGEAGTTVKLKLQRGAADPFEVTITRAQIKVESVSWEDKGNGVVLIELTRFGDGTTDEWD